MTAAREPEHLEEDHRLAVVVGCTGNQSNRKSQTISKMETQNGLAQEPSIFGFFFLIISCYAL